MPRISRLVINQEFAQIGIKITPAEMQITMPRRNMKIEQQMPEMEIEIEQPTFEINMKKVRNEIGFKDPMTLMRQMRDSAKSKIYNYIGESAQHGNLLARVEQKGNRIAGASRQKSLEQAGTEINIGLLPQSLPEIVWNKGSININWSNHNFNIEWEGDCSPEIVVDPKHSVEVYLRNRPSITITVEESEEEISEARHIDARL